MTPRRWPLGVALVVVACVGNEPRSASHPDRDASALAPNGATSDATADAPVTVDLSLVGDVPLDQLTATQAEALCEQSDQRFDPCLEQGIRATTTQDACQALVADCKASPQKVSPPTCSGVDFAAQGTCAATINGFLTCVDAWTASLECENARYQRLPPAPCTSVIDQCAWLQQIFFIDGDPWPCTPEESTYVPPPISDYIRGADGCYPEPARFVVLGDSIAACVGASGTATCAPYLIVDALRAGSTNPLEVEMHAESGGKTGDLLSQAEKVTGGPGHVFVWTFAIGNDLIAGNFDASVHLANYQQMFDYFTDTTRFPDGVTFLLNTQYGLYDRCDVQGAKRGYTPELAGRVTDLNQTVFIDVAESRPDAIAVENYEPFLGHGENANISGCPYCGADNTSWIAVALHPNDAGHAHLAERWIAALDGHLGATCTVH